VWQEILAQEEGHSASPLSLSILVALVQGIHWGLAYWIESTHGFMVLWIDIPRWRYISPPLTRRPTGSLNENSHLYLIAFF
jgi:hypothetical protein